MTELVGIIRSNAITHDPRVIKTMTSLSKSYNILVLGWDREGKYSRREVKGKRIEILRFPLKAPFGKATLALYYPLFWIWIFLFLVARKPRIIHACDFEALVPATIFHYFFSSKLIFDSFDRFAMAFIPHAQKMLFDFVNKTEDLFASKADWVISVSEERLQSFHYRQNSTSIIMNCPKDNPAALQIALNHKKSNDRNFNVVYAGIISRDRGLLELVEALTEIPAVRMILAGRIVHEDIFRRIIASPIVQYVGLLTYQESLELQAKATIIPLVYDPSLPINEIASPNKLFEAMMLGVPVISTVCKHIIQETKCGFVIDFNINQISRAIRELIQSPDLVGILGHNGRMAFIQKYNWNAMELRLQNVYETLLTS